MRDRLRRPFRVLLLPMALGVAALLLSVCSEPVRADLIKLKGGGEIRGEIDYSPGATRRPEVEITTLSGAVVTVSRSQIESISRRSMKVEQYETLVRRLPDTAAAHWKMAEWCLEQRLRRQREEHLRRTVELDPDHKEAHLALDHVLHQGEWLTQDEWKQSQGLVKYKGEWVSPQEKELLEEIAAKDEREKTWIQSVRQWKGYLNGNDRRKAAEAAAELRRITDPAAVPALTHFFSNEADPALRSMYVAILSQIEGPRPVEPLVKQSLYDVDSQVRAAALKAIPEEKYPIAAPLYAGELGHGNNLLVRRAAAALETVGDERVVSALVEALVTEHRYRVAVRDPGMSFSSDGGFGGSGVPLPPEIELGLLTGQLGGVIVNRPMSPQPTRMVTIRRSHQNPEALAALRRITGENFGFDERTWKLWVAAEKKGLVVN